MFTATTGTVQLTTVWGIDAAYDHFWRPDLRTSLYGGGVAVRYNALANASICAVQTTAPGAFPGAAGVISFTSPGATGVGTCNNNYSFWWIGSRTQWNITPWFYVGFDVMYTKLNTASNGALVGFTPPAGVAKPTALYSVANEDNVGFRVRVHRDIMP